MHSRSGTSKKLWGIFTRKERWTLSWRGWLLATSVMLFITYQVGLSIQPFLAVTHRVKANILVVEGWVHPYAIRAAVKEFENHSYERVFTTGGPVVGKGGYINDYQTSASVGADLLKEEGLPADLVQMVPSHVSGRDRTYSAAIALREWFRRHNMQVRSLNIVTEGAHARRTRLLFEEALGRDVKVGVIAVPSPDFDARHWWYYSEGLEEIVGEGLGYLYAKFFFYPRESESVAQTDPVGARHLSPEPVPAN
jgi:uncharacterized SAM-binding protein YcdF (DUF218 family)